MKFRCVECKKAVVISIKMLKCNRTQCPKCGSYEGFSLLSNE